MVPFAHVLTFFITLFATLVCSKNGRNIFIEYSDVGESQFLYRYFHDIMNEFYVDIGAYDPVYGSNTLGLYSQGWNGINVDASSDRMNTFFVMRPDQTNLNLAIGQESVFVTLYDLGEQGITFPNSGVTQTGAKIIKQQKVPSISLKQVCQNYFYRKPLYLSVDIQGYEYIVFKTNDWSNPKCLPDLIIVETAGASDHLPDHTLQDNGYVKHQKLGFKQSYIHSSKLKQYDEKFAKSAKLMQELQIHNLTQIITEINKYFNISTESNHLNVKTDPIFYKFTKYKEVIDLNKVKKVSNQLNPSIPNRPIVIFQFNEGSNDIVVKQNKYKLAKIVIGKWDFYEITVQDAENPIKVYIFDHKYSSIGFNKVERMSISLDSIQVKLARNLLAFGTIVLVCVLIFLVGYRIGKGNLIKKPRGPRSMRDLLNEERDWKEPRSSKSLA